MKRARQSGGGTAISRRTVLIGVTAAAGASIVPGSAAWATRPAASVASPGTSLIHARYDQRAYRFSPVLLRARAVPARWQRRVTSTAPWRDVEASAARVARFAPEWRDIGTEFRALDGNGAVIAEAVLACPTLTGIDPAAHGAVGDGVTDDTVALNLALSAAAGANTGVDLHGRTYVVSSRLKIVNGVTAVFGGTLVQVGASSSPLYFEGRAEGHLQNVSGCVICDVTIEMTAAANSMGIGGSSPSHIAVVNCTIGNALSPGRGVQIRGITDDVVDVTIHGNTVSLKDAEGVGIGVRAPWDQRGASDMAVYWKTYFQGPETPYTFTDVDISGNSVTGGYYGYELYAIEDFLLEANHGTMNMRNMSIQNSCLRGTVRDNMLSESISSSIHLAYGSSDCVIANNVINSTRAIGEGMLQAYVGTKGNTFVGNDVTVSSAAGPLYYAYCAIHADGNRFEGNTLSGSCAKAYIAVEAAWDPTNTHSAHRMTGVPAAEGYSIDSMGGVQLVDNTVDPTSSVEHICLADITDSAGTYAVVSPLVTGNYVAGGTTPIVPHVYVG